MPCCPPEINLPWQVEKIIEVARDLSRDGTSAGSTGEQIAAAFVLDRLDLLPREYADSADAWERLGAWKEFVRTIQYEHMHLISDRLPTSNL